MAFVISEVLNRGPPSTRVGYMRVRLWPAGVYYGLTICVVACTTGLSVLTLSLHHRGARGVEVPRSLRRLVLGFLAKLFLVGCCAPHGDDAQRKVSARESGAPHGDRAKRGAA